MDLSCTSIDNIASYNTAQFTVAASPGDITLQWQVTPYPGAPNNVTSRGDYDYAAVDYTNQFAFSYTSNTEFCDLEVFEGENWNQLRPWYAHYHFRPAFDWGSVYLYPGKYRYDLTCYKQNYQTTKKSLRLEITY